jgi:hypothetical protein
MPAGHTESELIYRARGGVYLVLFLLSYQEEAPGAIPSGAESTETRVQLLKIRMLNLADRLETFIQAMRNLEPVPSRYRVVHDELLREADAALQYLKSVYGVDNAFEALLWIDRLETVAFDNAIENWMNAP